MDWKKKFLEISEDFPEPDKNKKFLAGFNANIDRVLSAEKIIDSEIRPKDLERITKKDDLKSVLAYCKEKGKNKEIDIERFKPNIEDGKTFIGGQGGIVSTFASRIGANSAIYAPFISKRLSRAMDDEVLVPVTEKKFKNVSDAVNSGKTKENLIFEFKGDKTGRLILSDSLKGFEPVFMEDEAFIKFIDEEIDRFFFSGFHHISEEMVEKARNQLKTLNTPIHFEYVYTDGKKSKKIVEEILPCVESLGCDGDEMNQIAESIGLEPPESLNEHVDTMIKIMEKTGLSRFHIHTYEFHICVFRKDYGISPEKVLDSMVFGELCAIASAEKGDIPFIKDVRNFDFEEKHLKGVGKIEDFSETGIVSLNEFSIVAIPIIIHENPERLVGLGDIISSGGFFSEIF